MEYFTKSFWAKSIALAIHACGGAALAAVIEANTSHHWDWLVIGTAVGVPTLISLLTSVSSVKVPGTVEGSIIPTGQTVANLVSKVKNIGQDKGEPFHHGEDDAAGKHCKYDDDDNSTVV